MVFITNNKRIYNSDVKNTDENTPTSIQPPQSTQLVQLNKQKKQKKETHITKESKENKVITKLVFEIKPLRLGVGSTADDEPPVTGSLVRDQHGRPPTSSSVFSLLTPPSISLLPTTPNDFKTSVGNPNDNNHTTFVFTRQILRLGNGRCWIDKCFKLPPDLCMNSEVFERIWKSHPPNKGQVILYGKKMETPRWQQSYGHDYKFSGMIHKAVPLTDPFLINMFNRVFIHSGRPYYQILINWYLDGRHKIGWHSDDESELVSSVDMEPRIGIYSFSYGCRRRFDIRAKNEKKSELELYLPNNSCIIMGGECQQFYKHQIPNELRCKERRVNVTWRLLKSTFYEYKKFFNDVLKPWLINKPLKRSIKLQDRMTIADKIISMI